MNRIFLLLILWVSDVVASEWSPDFLIIGAQKSGTTALYHFLNQHPLVAKKMGETHYFDLNFDKDIAWYRSQFPERQFSGQLIGDKSPYYLFHPLVPQRVSELYPQVKILVILRNPVDRAYSQYWHNIRNKIETVSFAEAIDLEQERLSGEFSKFDSDPFYISYNYQKFSYQERGKYCDQLKRWLKYFSGDQIHIISSSDLKNKTAETMAKVFEFLELPPMVKLVPYLEGHDPYPAMDPLLREDLVKKFRPLNLQLESLLNRKFDWK